MTANQINYAKHLEDVRTHRTTEAIQAWQAESSSRQATAAEYQAAASIAQSETAARNAETNVRNAESNLLNAYANQTNAAANYQNALTNVKAQEETVRHNQAAEQNEITKARIAAEASKYGSDVSASNVLLQTQTSERNVDVQTRAGIVESLIGAAPKVIDTAVELLYKTGGLVKVAKQVIGGLD